MNANMSRKHYKYFKSSSYIIMILIFFPIVFIIGFRGAVHLSTIDTLYFILLPMILGIGLICIWYKVFQRKKKMVWLYRLEESYLDRFYMEKEFDEMIDHQGEADMLKSQAQERARQQYNENITMKETGGKA